jgi:ribonuclease P/MRP protein subunit RPP40
MQKFKKLLPPYPTSWIAERLSDRKQRVKCGNTYSLWELVVAGVIQGSVLNPILFLLYISDINEYLPSTTGAYHPKYADDILAYSTFIDIIDDHTQQSIDGMASWSEDNHMRLNTIKTQHMIISKKQQHPTQQFTATLNNINLKRVDKYDYLGVVLNNDMNYDAQWEVTPSKTNPQIYLLKKLRRMGFTEDKLVCIYKSLTLSQ